MTDSTQMRQQFDRLADGELNDEQLSQLLRHCDQNPDLWRALALSLIEAREIKNGLSEMFVPTRSSVEPSARGQSRRWNLPVWLAACCLAMLAFLVGWMVSGQRSDDLASSTSTSEETQVHPAVADPSESVAVVGVARIHHRAGVDPPLRVIGGADLDHEQLLQQTPDVPEHIEAVYRNKGLAVQSVRRVMSIQLADGQRLAIPLDQFGVRYVGNEVL